MEVPTSFDIVFAANEWKEIPNCPGRFTLSPKKVSNEDVTQFLSRCDPNMQQFTNQTQQDLWVTIFAKGEIVRDTLWVIKFQHDGCGLISYETNNGFLHTLNTPSGFERKLKALNIYEKIFPSKVCE